MAPQEVKELAKLYEERDIVAAAALLIGATLAMVALLVGTWSAINALVPPPFGGVSLLLATGMILCVPLLWISLRRRRRIHHADTLIARTRAILTALPAIAEWTGDEQRSCRHTVAGALLGDETLHVGASGFWSLSGKIKLQGSRLVLVLVHTSSRMYRTARGKTERVPPRQRSTTLPAGEEGLRVAAALLRDPRIEEVEPELLARAREAVR